MREILCLFLSPAIPVSPGTSQRLETAQRLDHVSFVNLEVYPEEQLR